MIQAGSSDDEYAVEAGGLNQCFIGLEFGYNVADRTVYGTLASVEVSSSHVTLWLANVPEEWSTLRLAPSDKLYFSRRTRPLGRGAHIELIDPHLEARGSVRT